MTELVHHFTVTQPRQGLHDLFMLGQGRTHLTEIPAFHQRQAVLHHFAPLPQADQAFGGHARGHAVFTTVQWLAVEVETPIQAQPERAVEHTIGFQAIESAGGGRPCRHIEQLLLGQIQRLLQGSIVFPGAKAQQQGRREQTDQQQYNQFSYQLKYPIVREQCPAVYG